MAIAVTCPSCGVRMRFLSEHAGRSTKCRACEARILVKGETIPDHDVFISYSSKDKNVADAICAGLEAKRVRCWIAPRDVLPGRQWAGAILDAISDARVMVLVYSAAANLSHQVVREVDRAVGRGVVIIPFRIEAAPMSSEMEYYIAASHWLDAMEGPLEGHVAKLVSTVRRLLDDRSTGPTPGAKEATAPTVVPAVALPPPTPVATAALKPAAMAEAPPPPPALVDRPRRRRGWMPLIAVSGVTAACAVAGTVALWPYLNRPSSNVASATQPAGPATSASSGGANAVTQKPHEKPHEKATVEAMTKPSGAPAREFVKASPQASPPPPSVPERQPTASAVQTPSPVGRPNGRSQAFSSPATPRSTPRIPGGGYAAPPAAPVIIPSKPADREIAVKASRVTAVAFAPQQNVLITGGDAPDNAVRLWDLRTGEAAGVLSDGLGALPVAGLALSPDGARLAVITGAPIGEETATGATLTVWNLEDRKQLNHFNLPSRSRVFGPWFANGGKTVFAFRGHTQVHAFDLTTGQEATATKVLDASVEETMVSAACLTADRSTVYAGVRQGVVRAWSLAAGTPVKRYPEYGGRVRALVLSGDDRYLASGSDDGWARVLDLATGHELAKCHHGGHLMAVCFVGDGPDRIVTAGDDGRALLWDTTTATPLQKFDHGDAVTSLAVSPGSRFLATGSADRTAKLWALPAGK